MTIRKGYSDGPEGQVHWRMGEPTNTPTEPDLYCFSPAPFSSIAYETILPFLSNRRRVIAPDYPGQGGSDGGSSSATIEQYATSMLAVISELSGTQPVDVTGFHSGTLVAVETALQNALQVARLVLVDVPAFAPKIRSELLTSMAAPFEPSLDLESLATAWKRSVTSRKETQALDECLRYFADSVANGSRMNATFHAAFRYDVEAKFAALAHPVAILATQSGLLDPSRRSAELLSNAKLSEQLDIEGSVLNQNAERTAAITLAELSAL